MVGRLGWAGVPFWTEPSWPDGGVGVDLGVGGEGEGGGRVPVEAWRWLRMGRMPWVGRGLEWVGGAWE